MANVADIFHRITGKCASACRAEYDRWREDHKQKFGITASGITAQSILHKKLNEHYPDPKKPRQARYRKIKIPALPRCKGKASYHKRDAETALNCRQRHSTKPLRIYQCDLCDFWHLAHFKAK